MEMRISETRTLALTALGCALITVGSLIRIPFYPVPFTLQTLAIFILGLTQSPKQAFASASCYLLCASAGLPVLDGTANALWMTGKCAGYLAAFPVAAYAIAVLRQKWPPFIALLCGQALILGLGWGWLALFIGAQAAFLKGVAIFIPSGLCKALAALSWVKWRGR